jgi:hypothetical protein
MNFTVEEENLMCIFEKGSRKNLLNILREDLKNDVYDLELREIYANTIAKLEKMSDEDFAALEFYPAYFDDEETEV